MKHFFSYRRLITAMLVFVITGTMAVFAQPTFRSRCPYDVNNWPYPDANDWLGCAPASFIGPGFASPSIGPCPGNYSIKPHQDCCGALPLCSLVNDVNSIGYGPTSGFNASICGPGCSPRDLPPDGETCFGNNERQTSWYIFEVRPLAGQPYVLGAPAGKLRFKIFPCDVEQPTCDGGPNTPRCNCEAINPLKPEFCNDFGTIDIGNVDYDWMVFKVDNFSTRRQACNSIASTTDALVCCNWSGARGPTGMFELPRGGQSPCNAGSAGNRYASPIDVFVGERFMIAIDGWTQGNLKGYKIDFRGTCADEVRNGITADVSPIPQAYKMDTVLLKDSNYCATGGVVCKFSLPTRNTEIGVNDFKVFQLDAQTPDGIDSVSFIINEVLPVDDPLQATLWRVNFVPGKEGRFAIRYRDTIPDICGNRYIDDTAMFTIAPYLVKNSRSNVRCALPNNLDTISVTLNPLLEFPNTGTAAVDTTIGIYDWQVLKLTAPRGEQNTNEDDWVTIPRPGRISDFSSSPFGNLVVTSPRASSSGTEAEWKKVSILYVSDSILENPGVTGIQNRFFRLKHRFPIGVDANPLSTGCTDQKTFTVRFFPIPNANIVSGDTTCYAEGPGGLSIIDPATQDRSYTWYSVSSNESPFLGDSVGFGNTLKPVTVPDEFSYYRVRVIDSTFGCENIIPNFGKPALFIRNAIQVVPFIEHKFENEGVATFPASVIYVNASKRLIGDRLEGLPSEGITYEWSFDGEPEVTTTTNFDQTFRREYRTAPPGTDTVRVKACLRAYDQLSVNVNSNTCILDTCIEVILKIPTFPNVITPGDGNPANDKLRFLAEGGEYELSVFNRWGQVVYENSDYKNDWDANNVPGGMYYYLVTNKKTKGTFKGWVQVLK